MVIHISSGYVYGIPKNKFMKTNLFISAGAFFLLIFASCKNDKNTTPPPARTDIHLDSNATVGTHIVDKDGRSLYFFSNDVNGGLANCTGGCLTNFPIFTAPANTTVSGGLLSTDLATITLTSGVMQTTYKGWPLYYFSPSGVAEAAGQTGGEGVGNIWFVAKTNYSIMIANNQLIGGDNLHYMSDYTPGDGFTNYLSDGNGNTLYTFAKDSFLVNKFTKPDFSNNPTFPMYETTNITVPSTLAKSLFAVINVNGRNQLTFNGWPLYYFGADSLKKGSTKAITFPPTQPVGAIWPVVPKDKPAAPTP
jgi:predicted lipoprotein with Yx(FWY)xxD motif